MTVTILFLCDYLNDVKHPSSILQLLKFGMFESDPETQDLSWSQIQGDGDPVTPNFGGLR